jgi:uncharacterized Zn-binding protein involved in type VI secretion
MPGFVVQKSASILCLHAGQARPAVGSPRVKLSGQPAVLQTELYTVSGCILPAPPAANGPCATAQWISGATRVRSGGVPLLIQGSQAVCVPSGTGLNIVATQTRVKAT